MSDSRLKSIKVVAVDDNADSRELLKAILERSNAEAAVVSSGQEALDAIKSVHPGHCRPVMRSSVMDCAFNDRDLRVKEDVSDLKLDPLFWRRVLWKNYFFASYRIHPSAAVRQVCGALSRQLQGQSVFVLGSVFVHGLCAINLSRESARHRRLSSRALRSTIPSGLPQPCLSQYMPMPTKCATGASTQI